MHVSIPILVIAGMLWATLTHALAIHSALVKANFTLPVGHVIDPNISPAAATEGDTQGDSLVYFIKVHLQFA
jgi:hypothetical protein